MNSLLYDPRALAISWEMLLAHPAAWKTRYIWVQSHAEAAANALLANLGNPDV